MTRPTLRNPSDIEQDAVASSATARMLDVAILYGVENGWDDQDVHAAAYLSDLLMNSTRRLLRDFQDLSRLGVFRTPAAREAMRNRVGPT